MELTRKYKWVPASKINFQHSQILLSVCVDGIPTPVEKMTQVYGIKFNTLNHLKRIRFFFTLVHFIDCKEPFTYFSCTYSYCLGS